MKDRNLEVPTYSFIIPHKNCPDLLNRCLESIPIRGDIQVILVDDNSDADKKPIVNRDNVELVLLDAEHSNGAGRARNIGIKRAKGKWLLFADADDYYTDNLSILLDKYAQDDVLDTVFFKSMMVSDDDIHKPLCINRFVDQYLKGKKNSEKNLRYGFFPVWSRMVKRDVVMMNHLLFEETPTGNDIWFGLNVSFVSKMIGVENLWIYNYYKWPNGSITERQKLIEEHIIQRGKVIMFYQKINYQSSKSLLSILESLLRHKKVSTLQAIRYYHKYLREYHISWTKDSACYFYDLLGKRMPQRILNK